jgi:Flp pilus assembly protein TadD
VLSPSGRRHASTRARTRTHTHARPQAISAFRRAAQLAPNDKYSANALGAFLLEELEHTGDSPAAARRALEADPNSAVLHRHLAKHLCARPPCARREQREATSLLRRSAELAPTDPIALAMLGWYLFASDQFTEAATQLSRAWELDPNSQTPPHEVLNSIRAMSGDAEWEPDGDSEGPGASARKRRTAGRKGTRDRRPGY